MWLLKVKAGGRRQSAKGHYMTSNGRNRMSTDTRPTTSLLRVLPASIDSGISRRNSTWASESKFTTDAAWRERKDIYYGDTLRIRKDMTWHGWTWTRLGKQNLRLTTWYGTFRVLSGPTGAPDEESRRIVLIPHASKRLRRRRKKRWLHDG